MSDPSTDADGLAAVELPQLGRHEVHGDGEVRLHDDGEGVSIATQFSEGEMQVNSIASLDEEQTDRLAELVEAAEQETETVVETKGVDTTTSVVAVLAAAAAGWSAAHADIVLTSVTYYGPTAFAAIVGLYLLVSGMNRGDVMGGGGR